MASQVDYRFAFTGSGTFEGVEFTDSPVQIDVTALDTAPTSATGGTVDVGGMTDSLYLPRITGCPIDPYCVILAQTGDILELRLDGVPNGTPSPVGGQPFPLTNATVLYFFDSIIVGVPDFNAGDVKYLQLTSVSDATYSADVSSVPEPNSLSPAGAGILFAFLAAYSRLSPFGRFSCPFLLSAELNSDPVETLQLSP
jgi:hypothetical protein